MTGPATATAGAVSTAFTLTSLNADGNAADVTADTKFDLASNSSGTKAFYSNAAGTSVITQLTLKNGTNTAEFFYKDATPGTPKVTATRTSGMALGSATHDIIINGKPAIRVNLTGPATATAGAVSTAFTLTSLDADGNAADVTADTKFDLASNSSGTKAFYSNAAGTSVITQLTLKNGTNTAEFFYKDATPGTPKVTATRTSGMALGSATHNIIINGKPAIRVNLTGPATATAGAVSTAFTLTSLDADGNAADVTADTKFDLASNSSGTKAFYSNAAGTTAITQLTLQNGTNTAEFFYKDATPGTPKVTATRTSGMALGSATHDITINGKPAGRVNLTGPATATAGAVSTAFTLTSLDADGNAADVTANTKFDLASNSSGTKAFYDNAAGTSVIDQVTIPNGTSTAEFFYKDATPGTPKVTATRTSGMALGSATHDIIINGKPAIRVNLTGPATATAGAVSTAFTLTSLDADGNAADVTADTKFDLASNSSGTKAFYSNAAGTSVITQVTIPNGTSTAAFYYKDGNAGTPTITAAWNNGGTDLGSDTFQPTVSLAATTLATSTSVASSFTHFEVTVVGIRMGHNGANWVTIFSGVPPAKLDLVNGGTFSGISGLSLPSGTYNQVEVTFKNSLPVTGKLTYGSKTYYTTAATFGGASNIAGDPSNDPGSQTVFTFRISDWGALNANVAQTFNITPITVDESTDYQPTLTFTISNKFLLKGIAGTPQTYYLALSEPGVALAP